MAIGVCEGHCNAPALPVGWPRKTRWKLPTPTANFDTKAALS